MAPVAGRICWEKLWQDRMRRQNRSRKASRSGMPAGRAPLASPRVLEIGLTGGIGSGKSTVATLLVGKGAVLIDADVIVRDVQRPGSPVLAAMVERFGGGILTATG
jgi:polynucleotide 5'-kinase involved in rRNA processing